MNRFVRTARCGVHDARWARCCAAVVCLAAVGAFGNPLDGTVVSGQVSMQRNGNLLQITNTPGAIIHWRSFSIGAGEITRFVQSSAGSAVLNRVVGAGGMIDPSVILGSLQSNGRVFLVNPAGIVFGAGAQVDVAGLVASSLNLSNADFLAGRLRFTETPGAGAVVNHGAINAAPGGEVYLVGSSVANSGIIRAPGGEVLLAAGRTVELVNPGTPNLRVELSAPDSEALNLGEIAATAGRIGIYAGLVRSNGSLNADSAVTGPAGEILLKATRTIAVQGILTAREGLIRMDAGLSVAIDLAAPGSVAVHGPTGGQVTGGTGPTPSVVVIGNAGSVTVGGKPVVLTPRPLQPSLVAPPVPPGLASAAEIAFQQANGPVVDALWSTMEVNDVARLLGAAFRARHAPRAHPVFE